MSKGGAVIDVAVGVVEKQQAGVRRVLLAWREASLHQGNRHEFPGGKVEAGETPRQALARELHEELGITVTAAQAVRCIEHAYLEKNVRLHVFWVTAWQGDLVGQQGQALCWVPVGQLSQYRLPDANAPIVRLAQLPHHYCISPSPHQDPWVTPRWPVGAWVYLRQPQASCEKQWADIQALATQRPDLHWVAPFGLRDHVDFFHLQAVVRGFHLTQAELMAQTHLARPEPSLCFFAACHDRASLQQAERLGVDAVTLGPVRATPTHPHARGQGWAWLASLTAQVCVPVYALGGVGPDDLAQAQRHGAWGVAGIRAFAAPQGWTDA